MLIPHINTMNYKKGVWIFEEFLSSPKWGARKLYWVGQKICPGFFPNMGWKPEWTFRPTQYFSLELPCNVEKCQFLNLRSQVYAKGQEGWVSFTFPLNLLHDIPQLCSHEKEINFVHACPECSAKWSPTIPLPRELFLQIIRIKAKVCFLNTLYL